MAFSGRITNPVSIVTSLAMLAMNPALATHPEPTSPAPMTVDVSLAADGVLRGYVVNAQGVPRPEVEVHLTSPAGNVVATVSDAKGRFGFRGLAGGSYQLETEYGVVLCRAWAKAAPPRSAATLLLVHDAAVARGQWAAPPAVNGAVSRMKRVMTNPLAVATIVGAAVAIPVAIHNANQDDSSS